MTDTPLAPWDDLALIGAMTRTQREERVRGLIEQSHDILNDAIERHVQSDGRFLPGLEAIA
jgi:hypothetical protein